ncbi:hypothetical protein [Salinicoccus roseus]|uniref:hypothetical protein n=1 Tax=Salinicoccus roseus TaxID=45670 RepID=UPI003564C045
MSAEPQKPIQLQERMDTGSQKERETYNPERLMASPGYLIDSDGNFHLVQSIGGDIDMNNFITKGEFDQFEKRIDQKLDTIEGKVDGLPERLDDKIKLHFEIMKTSQMKWFIGVSLALAGLAGRVFGLY